MSIMDSDGLSTGEMMSGLGETIDDRDALGRWMKQPRQFGSNMTGIVILCLVLVAIIVVFFGCYLLLRFMHRALSSDDRKNSNSSPYSNVVIHSKRVYEIQAEEGCFSGPPDIHEIVEDPALTSPSEDQHSINSSTEGSPRSSMKRPETGDLKTMRHETTSEVDDPRQLMRKKERKVHKDSVCAFLFRPEPQPRMI